VKKGAWFLDFNSASPGAKHRAADLIDRHAAAATSKAL